MLLNERPADTKGDAVGGVERGCGAVRLRQLRRGPSRCRAAPRLVGFRNYVPSCASRRTPPSTTSSPESEDERPPRRAAAQVDWSRRRFRRGARGGRRRAARRSPAPATLSRTSPVLQARIVVWPPTSIILPRSVYRARGVAAAAVRALETDAVLLLRQRQQRHGQQHGDGQRSRVDPVLPRHRVRRRLDELRRGALGVDGPLLPRGARSASRRCPRRRLARRFPRRRRGRRPFGRGRGVVVGPSPRQRGGPRPDGHRCGRDQRRGRRGRE